MSNSAEPEKQSIESNKEAVRVRFPIALKLILASGTLVLLIAAGFVIEGLVATQRRYKQFAESRRTVEVKALETRGLTTVRNLKDSMAPMLLESDIDRLLEMAKAVVQSKGSEVTISEIEDVVVTKIDGKVVACATQKHTLGEVLKPANLLSRLKELKTESQLDKIEGSTLPETISFGSPVLLGGRLLGYIYLQKSTARIVEELRNIEAERKKEVRDALIKTIALGLGALFIGILIAVFQGLRFGRAIGHLTQVADEVGRGNLAVRAVATTKDEIGVLCERFNDMTSRVDVLLKESVEKAALDQELERANAIQNLLMPSRDFFQAGGISYCGLCEPASKVGGDWWHHYTLSDEKILLCVGDVTGHGIPSAMLTASTKACCDTYLFENQKVDISRFMRILDHSIRESGKGELVMTFFAGMFDIKEMTVEFANAGHNFPLLYRKGKAKSLVARGGRLGDGAEYSAIKQPVEKDDLIVFYTDGIVECESEEGEEYGMRRFRKLLKKHFQEPLPDLRQRLMDDAYNFYGNMPRMDDITLVLCRID